MRRAWFLFLLLACATLAAQGDDPGTTGAQFLRIPTSVRAAGMAGAYTALAEGPEAVYWNAAGLAPWDPLREPGVALSAEHVERFGGVSFDHLAAARPFGEWGWGLSVTLLRAEDTRRVAPGVVIGTFTNSDVAYAIAMGRTVGPVDLGLTYRRIESRLDMERASANAFDFGARYRLRERLTIGATARNLGGRITFFQIGDPLPTEYRAGVAYQSRPRPGRDLGWYVLAVDAVKPRELDARVALGGEIRPMDFLALRVGYLAGADLASKGVTAGVGVTVQNVSMDYAYEPYEDLGEAHRVGLRFDFAPRAGAPAPPPPAPARETMLLPGEARPAGAPVLEAKPALAPKIRRVRKWRVEGRR